MAFVTKKSMTVSYTGPLRPVRMGGEEYILKLFSGTAVAEGFRACSATANKKIASSQRRDNVYN
jgi:hypothetical protein